MYVALASPVDWDAAALLRMVAAVFRAFVLLLSLLLLVCLSKSVLVFVFLLEMSMLSCV